MTVSGGLGEKIDTLFRMHTPSHPPLSNAAAATAIHAATGVSISPAYLWQLRTGLKNNPTINHLRAIAVFFGVPPSFLIDTDSAPEVEQQIGVLAAFRDAAVVDLARRASGLSPAALDHLASIADHIRALEKLPPVGGVPSAPRRAVTLDP